MRGIKRILSFVLLLTLSFPIACALAQDEFHPQGSPLRKLERGGANLLLGGMEFVYHLREPDRGSVIPPWIVGIGKSVYYAVRRTVVGVYEIVTFPIPVPADFLPVIGPEFVWEYPPRKK